MKSFKLLCIALLCVTVFLAGCAAAEAEPGQNLETVPAVYQQILDRYGKALRENWSGQQLVDAGMNLMIRDVASETVGYALEDLDGDGTPELILGAVSGDEFYGKLVFQLYTLDDSGAAVQVLGSMDRDCYYYAGGALFAHVGSGGADNEFATTVKLENKALTDLNRQTAPENYVQLQLLPLVG